MKFTKGLIIGGLLTTGVLKMYNEKDMLKNSRKKILNVISKLEITFIFLHYYLIK